MKRLLIILFILIMTFSLIGCNCCNHSSSEDFESDVKELESTKRDLDTTSLEELEKTLEDINW